MTPYSRRLVVAAFGIPLVLVCVYVGGWTLAAFIAAVGLLGSHEGYRLLAPGAHYLSLLPILVAASVLPALAVMGWPVGPHFVLAACVVLAAVTVLTQSPEAGGVTAVAVLVLLLYPLLLLQHLLWLRLEFGWFQVLYLLALVWAGDTAAYEGGKRMGRRPLAPRLSPKKTQEGAAWALVASLAVGVLAWRLDGGAHSGLWYAASAVLVWFLATVGDLFESLLKRKAGVKDSSRLLSEHGGILDRFDSLLFASVGLYYLNSMLP